MKKIYILIAIFVLLFGGSGFVIYKLLAPTGNDNSQEQTAEPISEVLPQVADSVKIDVVTSGSKANTIILKIDGLENKYSLLGYEISYDSEGLIKGVNSGSKPLDISNQEAFSRDIYLGTCSKNVCKPDAGVEKVTIALEFTDTDGKKSQFMQDFEI